MRFQSARFLASQALILVALAIAACGSSAPSIAPDREDTELQAEAVVVGTEPVTGVPTSVPASTLASSPRLGPAWDDRAVFREGLIGAEQGALDGLAGASVYHIDLQIPDDFRHLKGYEEVLYTNREDEPLGEVYFRTFPNIAGGAVTVSDVQVNGQEVVPIFEFEDSALRVPMPETLRPGEQAVIQMDFGVAVTREMGGNYGLFGYFGDFLVLDEFYPVIPVYDDEGWNVEVPPPNGDLTYYDASFYLVRVAAPANLTVVASGREIAREDEGDQQVLTFAAGPARDFYLAAGETLSVTSDTLGETAINSYTLPKWEQGAELALQVAKNALESFSQRFGTYPYTEFDIVSTPMLALGIEYPGMTAVRVGLYDPNAEIYGLPSQVMLESTVAHEVAHQWFYNAVGNDQVDEPWLDEALVQYVTSLYYDDIYGESAARNFRGGWDWRWNRVNRMEIPIGLPSRAYAVEEYNPIVYGRGPYFIAALAEEMGQEAFDDFLRDYYKTHKWGEGASSVKVGLISTMTGSTPFGRRLTR